jgi:type IV pilus assembly protein PilE
MGVALRAARRGRGIVHESSPAGRQAARAGRRTVACRAGAVPRIPGMKHCSPVPLASQRGFTLIELMVAVVVAGLLAAIAYPSFTDSIRKSRRADAIEAMNRVQQAQERYRSNNPNYADATQLTTAWPGGLGQSAISTSGYYTVATAVTSAASNVAYSVTATAVTGKSQASDKAGAQACNVLTMTITSGAPAYSPTACWSR